MKYYVVSDIHGYYTALQKALKKSGYYKDEGQKKLIICGDLCDRGYEAKEVQDFVLELMKKDEVILLRGNHEDLLEELLENAEKWFTPSVFNTHHFTNGTVETVLQLTGHDLQYAILYPERVRRRMEETPLVKKILPAMQNYYETSTHVFVHGWVPAKITGNLYRPAWFSYREDWRSASEEDWKMARWHNGMQACACGAGVPKKTVVCGHYHASFGHSVIEGKSPEWGENADHSPYYGGGIIAIDGCTAVSGQVNCIVVEA